MDKFRKGIPERGDRREDGIDQRKKYTRFGRKQSLSDTISLEKGEKWIKKTIAEWIIEDIEVMYRALFEQYCCSLSKDAYLFFQKQCHERAPHLLKMQEKKKLVNRAQKNVLQRVQNENPGQTIKIITQPHGKTLIPMGKIISIKAPVIPWKGLMDWMEFSVEGCRVKHTLEMWIKTHPEIVEKELKKGEWILNPKAQEVFDFYSKNFPSGVSA